MNNLSTNYMGIKLKTPLIAGSCGLTHSVKQIKEMAKHGAGAVVLKSLFEEQIIAELQENIESYNTGYPVAFDYIREYTRDNAVSEYLSLIKRAKEEVDIPIIASINCVSSDEWLSFAKAVEGRRVPTDLRSTYPSYLLIRERPCGDYERVYFDVVDQLTGLITIPVALKMSLYSSALANVIERLSWGGKVKAFVLFNRYYRPDFDIENLTLQSANIFSTPEEMPIPLRWIALLSAKIDAHFGASTGVHDSSGVIKMLLAGACTVQMVSAIYEKGPSHFATVLAGLEEWMEKKGFSSLDDFRGKLAWQDEDDTSLQRMQFMKYFAGIQ